MELNINKRLEMMLKSIYHNKQMEDILEVELILHYQHLLSNN